MDAELVGVEDGDEMEARDWPGCTWRDSLVLWDSHVVQCH